MNGTFSGYTFAKLTKNFGFRILKNPSANATTINYGYTSIYDAYIKTEENTFLFVADITNLDIVIQIHFILNLDHHKRRHILISLLIQQ